MAETFELSDASKSPRFVIYTSASLPPSTRIVGNVYPIFITLFFLWYFKCFRLSLESEDISSTWLSTRLRPEYSISSYYLDTVELRLSKLHLLERNFRQCSISRTFAVWIHLSARDLLLHVRKKNNR